MFKTYEGQVYIQNGNTRVPHTVRINADSSWSAQQQLAGMYGANNVISIPSEVRGPSGGQQKPDWMR